MSTTPTAWVVAAPELHVRLDAATAAAAEDQRLRSDPFVRDVAVELPLNEFVRRRLAAGDLVRSKKPTDATPAGSARKTATTSEK